MRGICVLCGSKSGRNEAYSQAAESMGRLIAVRGCRLIDCDSVHVPLNGKANLCGVGVAL